jgi:sugar lactone lactonase YvrE
MKAVPRSSFRNVVMRNASALVGLCGAALLAAVAAGCGGGGGHHAAAAPLELAVADFNNNRVLTYKPPFSTGMDAHHVLGQSDFVSGLCNQDGSLSATTLCEPFGGAVDPSGNGWVADSGNDRVLEYPAGSKTGAAASIVLGEPDFTTDTACTTSLTNTLCYPEGVVSDKDGNIWVADEENCRVVEFKPPFSNGMDASVVLGQANLTDSCVASTPSQNGLDCPKFLTFDKSGNLWVSDFCNDRVLEFSPPFANGMDATAVLGEPDFTHNTGCSSTTASALCDPAGVAFDSSGNLWVGDDGYCRAVRYTAPFTSGMAASVVLGQANFTDDCVTTSGQAGLDDAGGVGVDPVGNVYVSDYDNNRVMRFSPPFSNGMNASLVIGQPDFNTTTANTTQSGLRGPWGLSTTNTP